MANEYIKSEKIWRAPYRELKYPNTCLGPAILEKLKHTDPHKVLEVEHETKASLTAGEIRHQTITIAKNLIRIGVKNGDIVIVFSRSNLKITPITFALYTIGAPINFFFLDLNGDDIKHYFEELNPTAILYEEEFKNDIFHAVEKLNLSKLKHVLSLDSEIGSVDEVLFKPTSDIETFQPPDLGDPNELIALLPLTPGHTGRPKIVMHSHSMVLLGLYNKWWQMDAESVVCVLSDLRSICQVELMLQPVFFDVKRIYSSRREEECSDAYEYELLFKNKVTHFCTGSMHLLHTLQYIEKLNKSSTLSQMRRILVGAEIVSKSLIEYSAKILQNCKIVTCYEMTELPGIISSNEEVPDCKNVNGGVLANEYILKVIDPDGHNLGPNQNGRLCLKSKVKFLGYYKNDKENQEHFEGDGWYITEDYGYMDSDHLLNVVIRCKNLLRYNGQFVVPTDIEKIINNHPSVLTSALVGYPDPENIDSEIGTIFVFRNQVRCDSIEDELLRLLQKNLTNEQTKLVRFMKVIEESPMFNFANVDRSALKNMASSQSNTYLKI